MNKIDQLKPEVNDDGGNRIMYKYYIHDILVASSEVEKTKNTYKIRRISTINFQTNDEDDHEQLEGFSEDLVFYEEAKKSLKIMGIPNYIPQLGSFVFSHIINDIQSRGEQHWVELYVIPTARGFYDKVGYRLKEKEIIKLFDIDEASNRITIHLK